MNDVFLSFEILQFPISINQNELSKRGAITKNKSGYP
jgi:hypothetical protein